MEALMCLVGEFWNESLNACFPCPDGTFNFVPGYNTWCAPCMKCQPFAHLVYACNKTQDNFCICDDGYASKPSKPKICSKTRNPSYYGVFNFTKDIPSNFSTMMEQAATSAATNTSAAADQGCRWTPWLPAWSCFSPAAIVFFCCLLAGLLIFIYRNKKLQTKCQQPKALMLDCEQHQQNVPEEKNKLLPGDQVDQNSMANDARNSLSQFNSGGSGRASTPESCSSMCGPDSVRFTAYDPSGFVRKDPLPSSSLCDVQESFRLSLHLIEDEVPTPIKEVAEGTHYNT